MITLLLFRFMDKWLKIKRAKAPQLYNWENLNTSRGGRCIRYVVTGVASMLLLILTLALILALTSYQNELSNNNSEGSCNPNIT